VEEWEGAPDRRGPDRGEAELVGLGGQAAQG